MAGKRRPYTPEDRQRALTALYASGEEVNGEWVPNFFAVSKMAGMPVPNTLSKWWRERDGDEDCKHLQAAQRAREQARQQGGDAFYQEAMEKIRGAVAFILDPKHQGDVGPTLQQMGLHQYSRAIKDATMTVRDWQKMMAPPPEQTPSSSSDIQADLRARLVQVGLLKEEG